MRASRRNAFTRYTVWYAHPITSHSLLHIQTHTKTPMQPPTQHTSDKRALLPSWFSLVIGCLVFTTTQYESGCCVCVCELVFFIPVFNVVWLRGQGVELISFLMVWYQCLSQMNYAFLPYVISSLPGNTGTILVTRKQIILCWLPLRFN